MDETDELIGQARDCVDKVITCAAALLRSGADAGRVHHEYIVATFDLLSEAEAQGLLAASGDQAARRALKDVIVRLARLQSEAQSERTRYAEGDCE